jgi:hypothetical protein
MSRQYQILNFGKLIRIDRPAKFAGLYLAEGVWCALRKPCLDLALAAISTPEASKDGWLGMASAPFIPHRPVGEGLPFSSPCQFDNAMSAYRKGLRQKLNL